MANQAVKTKFIEKTHEKVWNITDHPSTDVAAQAVMVAGKAILPGQAVRVPLEMLEDAKKLQKMVDDGMIAMGPQPPKDYMLAKGQVRASAPAKAGKAHGERVPGGGALQAEAPVAAPVETQASPSTMEKRNGRRR